jgi:hypothetical protein
MSLKFEKFPLFAPADTITGSATSTGNSPATSGSNNSSGGREMGAEDILQFLQDDNEQPEVINLDDKAIPPKAGKEKDDEIEEEIPPRKGKDDKDEKEEIDEKEEKTDELTELEAELEEPTPDQLDIATPVPRREILAKFPTLFKEFPYLEKAYYREQQFTKHFPTPADAEEAVAKVQTLDKFESDLDKGNTEPILQAVKRVNPESFNRVVDDYLPTLYKVDKDAYHHVIGNVIKHTIASMASQNNEVLRNAALILNQYVFNSDKYTPPSRLSQENTNQDPRVKEIEERERQFNENRLKDASTELNTRVNTVYKATIEANIDPKNSMTEYVKKNAIRDAQETLSNLIMRDGRFKTVVDKLWEKAIENNYNKADMDRIRTAYVSRAKTLLPSVLKKARQDALRGMGVRVKSDDKEETTSRQRNVDKEEPPHSRSNSSGRKGEIPRGMSSLDYLMQD